MNSCIYNGEVTHTRFKPVRHFLKYKTFSLLIDLDEINLNKPLEITNSYKMQIEHFLDVIEGEDDIAIWMEACIYPLRIIKTGMKSIERKRKIYINYF